MEGNNHSLVVVEMDSSDTQPTKRARKNKSMVWDHFTAIETSTPGTTKAFCKYCNKSYAYISGSKTSGTSHLKRHIELGSCPMSPGITQIPRVKEETAASNKRQRSPPNLPLPLGLDQDRCNLEMAKMIIMHDYPLHMVEHPGFAGFVKALRPQFSMASYNTIHGDCVTMFLSQKQKLLDSIGEIPGAVNLTVDLWSSNQSMGYAFVTGHFLDKDWSFTRRLLNVSLVVSPDSDFALNQPLADCLSDWKLEGKISSLAVSKSLVNENCIDNLRGFLSARNQHVLNGQLLMGNCYARLLSSMAQYVLEAEQFQAPIKKVRDSIKYVKTNNACGERFDELKKQFPALSSKKDLFIDNQTRWDTSYNMLLAACEHKQVFSRLETCHPDYKIAISSEEWGNIESLCSSLKVLFEAVNVLTRPNHLTANDLYHEMTNLQLELSHAAMSEDPNVRDLANSLREKFDLYWRGCYLVLAVAVVLDPRCKMHRIESTFTTAYGEDAEKWIKTVADAVHDLYLNYSEHSLLDAYVDHGFSEAEMAQESHFHQDMPQDTITGNVQPEDETSPHVEHTTEPCPIAEGQQLGDGSRALPIAKEGQQVGDGSRSYPIAEEGQQLREDSREHPVAEEAQQLGEDSREHPISEEAQQLGDDSREHPVTEEGQELGNDSGAHPIAEEGQKLGDDAGAQPTAEEGQELGDDAGAQPTAEEGQELGDDAGAQPTAEEGQGLGDDAGAQPMAEEGQELGDDAGAQPTAEEGQELGDDAGAQPTAEEGQELGDDAGAQSTAEEGQGLGDDAGAQPMAEEGQELGDDAGAQPMAEEGQGLGDDAGAQPMAEEGKKLGDDAGAQPTAEEGQELGDDAGAHPMAEEGQQLGDDAGAHPMAEEGQQLGDDSGAHPMAEEDHTPFMEEKTTESHLTVEEDKQLGDDSHEHPIPEEDRQLGADSHEHPIPEEAQPLGDDSHEHPIAEEDHQLRDDSQAHPIVEEDHVPLTEEQTTKSGEHEKQDKVDKQNGEKIWDGVTEEIQLTEENHQLCDDSEAHAMEVEDHPLYTNDVLLQEGSTLVTIGDSLSDFEIYISEMKTELDQYLEDTLIPRTEDFNVLSWWRLNSTNYPTLSKIAADILSVPFCTVSPDSVFDTEVKKMDNYKTSLSSVTLEALLCTKDWLKNPPL